MDRKELEKAREDWMEITGVQEIIDTALSLLDEKEKLGHILSQRRELILSLAEELGDHRAGIYAPGSVNKLFQALNVNLEAELTALRELAEELDKFIHQRMCTSCYSTFLAEKVASQSSEEKQ